MASRFTIGSFLGRWLFAAALVFASYNPTEYSYARWLMSGPGFTPLVAVLGIVLLIGWVIYLRATFVSIGWLGVSLGVALFASIIWLLVDIGWLSLTATNSLTWLALLLLSLILATGMSWSHVHRRMTGQVAVDEVED